MTTLPNFRDFIPHLPPLTVGRNELPGGEVLFVADEAAEHLKDVQSMSCCERERRAQDIQLAKVGVRKVREPKRCTACGCKTFLVGKTGECYECAVRVERKERKVG